MLAPALAAATALSAICSGVTGRCGDMLGVWIEPVTAQVMMTLREPMVHVLFGRLLPERRGRAATIGNDTVADRWGGCV